MTSLFAIYGDLSKGWFGTVCVYMRLFACEIITAIDRFVIHSHQFVQGLSREISYIYLVILSYF